MSSSTPSDPLAPTTTVATSGVRTGQAIGRFLTHPGEYRLALAIAFVVVILAGVIVGRFRGAPGEAKPVKPRWVHRPDGSVQGPRLARYRIRRDLAPLVHQVRRWTNRAVTAETDYTLEGPDELGVLEMKAERVTARANRRIARWWSREVNPKNADDPGAFAWRCRFVSFTVYPDRRVLVVSAKQVPTGEELSRLLHELRVLSHHEMVGVARVGGASAHIAVTFRDAEEAPIDRTVDLKDGYWKTTTIDGVERAREWVSRPGHVEVTIGREWSSVYEHGVAWYEPGGRYLNGDEPIATVSHNRNSTAPLSVGVRLHAGTGPDPDPGDPDPDPLPSADSALRLSDQQMTLLAALADRPARVAAVATSLGRDPRNVRRSLKRLADSALVESLPAGAPDGTWHLTADGRYLLGRVDPDAPLPPPPVGASPLSTPERTPS